MANQFTAADALLREYMANGEGATCTVSWLRQYVSSFTFTYYMYLICTMLTR